MRVRKKTEKPNGRELRDQPVPPVKGAVNQAQDVLLRPDTAMQSTQQVCRTPEKAPDQWL